MITEKPLKLISLLQDILAETDKPTIGRIYIEIAKETMNTRFLENQETLFLDLIYRHLIRLSIKEYIDSNQSAESVKTIMETIDTISGSEIIVG
jgi:hypothetical protein